MQSQTQAEISKACCYIFLSEAKKTRKVWKRLYILFACISHRHELVLDTQKLIKCLQGAQKTRMEKQVFRNKLFVILIFEPCKYIT